MASNYPFPCPLTAFITVILTIGRGSGTLAIGRGLVIRLFALTLVAILELTLLTATFVLAALAASLAASSGTMLLVSEDRVV